MRGNGTSTEAPLHTDGEGRGRGREEETRRGGDGVSHENAHILYPVFEVPVSHLGYESAR